MFSPAYLSDSVASYAEDLPDRVMQYPCTGTDTPGGLPLSERDRRSIRRTAISPLPCRRYQVQPEIGLTSVANVGGTFDRILPDQADIGVAVWIGFTTIASLFLAG